MDIYGAVGAIESGEFSLSFGGLNPDGVYRRKWICRLIDWSHCEVAITGPYMRCLCLKEISPLRQSILTYIIDHTVK